MIKKLQKYKAKHGYTMVEIIVVIGILTALAATIIPNINVEKNKMQEACGTARDFYYALQVNITRYMMYEAPLSPAYRAGSYDDTKELGLIKYYINAHGNYPYVKGSDDGEPPNEMPVKADIFIEFQAKNDQIVFMNCANTAKELYKQGDDVKNTEFARLLSSELKSRLKFNDGFYYAKISYNPPADLTALDTVRVAWTAFSFHRRPQLLTDDFSTYTTEHLTFTGKDYRFKDMDICGTCSPDNGTLNGVGRAGTSLT